MTAKEIRALRAEIGRIDSEMMELIRRRMEASREIGLTKQKEGLPVRDKAREREVIEGFARSARSLSLDESLATDIAQLLIDDSLKIQAEDLSRPLQGQTALVVGGSGRMGEWFCRFLSNRGADVALWDPRGRLLGYRNLKAIELGAQRNIIVIASPLGAASRELKQVLACEPSGLVFDLCSIKSHIAKLLKDAAAKGVQVTSIHPMFGPGACSPMGRNVVVCDCGSAEAVDRVTVLLREAGANVSRTSLDRHDELMAYVLGLSHLCSLLFVGTIRAARENPESLCMVQGPSFQKMCRMARELSSESKRVYHDIQALNPNTRGLIARMEQVLRELKVASLDGDPSRFARIMVANRDYLEVD